MTRKINKFFLISIFSLLLLLSGFSFNFDNISFAETSGETKVSVMNRENTNIPVEKPTSQYINGYEILNYEWKNCNGFVIRFAGNEIEPLENEEMGQFYNLSLKIEFMKGYVSNNLTFSPNLTAENVVKDAYFNTSSLNGYERFSYSFKIDDGVETYKGINSWGIYRFTVNVNGTDYPSALYNIAPSTEAIKPIFTCVKESVNNSSVNFQYVCKITNSRDFKYADTSKLIWYVYGTSTDGTTYALTEEDQILKDCDAYFYRELERTGIEFTFNDKKTTGEWKISCEYSPLNQTLQKSDTIIIRTGFHFNNLALIITISSIAALGILIVTLVEFIKSKKEKVW